MVVVGEGWKGGGRVALVWFKGQEGRKEEKEEVVIREYSVVGVDSRVVMIRGKIVAWCWLGLAQ